jgi:hypothetical protein
VLDRATVVACALPCPPWSSSADIEVTLRALAGASEKTGLAACSGVLFSVGNHHAHTYWPAVLAVIPRLAPILRDGTELARARTPGVLIDLILLFAPEPGFEYVDTPAGPRALAHLVRDEIRRLSLAIDDLASSEETSSKVSRSPASCSITSRSAPPPRATRRGPRPHRRCRASPMAGR